MDVGLPTSMAWTRSYPVYLVDRQVDRAVHGVDVDRRRGGLHGASLIILLMVRVMVMVMVTCMAEQQDRLLAMVLHLECGDFFMVSIRSWRRVSSWQGG